MPPDDSPDDYLVRRVTSGRSSSSSGWSVPRPSPSTANGSRPTTAILDIGGSVLVNSAYLAPPYQISAIGPADLFDRLKADPTFRPSSRPGSRPSASGSRSPSRSRSTCPPTSARSPCATRGRSRRRPPRRRTRPAPSPSRELTGQTMNRRKNQLTIAVVPPPRAARRRPAALAEAGNGLDQLTSQELTVLVGNLNARNDQLRGEIATPATGAVDAPRTSPRATPPSASSVPTWPRAGLRRARSGQRAGRAHHGDRRDRWRVGRGPRQRAAQRRRGGDRVDGVRVEPSSIVTGATGGR